jgi:DNA-binding SARP family transcriptional activator
MMVSVLGPLRVTIDGRNITPSAPKLRSLLTVMALRHGHMVSTTSLMQELWGDDAPISSLATLQTYVYHLRKLLSETGASGKVTIITKPLGYVLQLDEKLDNDVFDGLVDDARHTLGLGNPEKADQSLNAALELISGPPLFDVDGGPMLMAHVAQLREGVLRALELHIDTSIELGRYGETISRLKSVIIEYPFHENFYAKLMIVLQHDGRRCEALDVYQQLRNTLVSELGIEPSGELRDLQQTLLAGDAVALATPASSRQRNFARPAQLPPDIADFVGRQEQLSGIKSEITQDGMSSVRLVSITGMPGVGKTALATRLAHSIRSYFPDGQFYAVLHGSEDDPADPFVILGGCLRGIGLRDEQIPDNLVERTQLFRSWSAERKVLVVLDDAATAAQAVPLLPGGAGCCVIVTSRSLLPGLAGACMIELDTLDLDECVSLLVQVAGLTRLGSDSEAARTIAQLCGRLPLAIRAVGTRLRAAPRYSVDSFLVRLADEHSRLRELRFGELDMSARLRPSYRRLGTDARDILRNLVSKNVKAFSVASVASLLGIEAFRIEPAFDRLVQYCFLSPMDSGSVGEALFGVPPFVSMFVESEESVGLD